MGAICCHLIKRISEKNHLEVGKEFMGNAREEE